MLIVFTQFLRPFFFQSDPESDTFHIYWTIEQKCRKYVKMILTWVVLDHTMTFASLFYSFYYISIGNVDSSQWILPFDLLIPFGTKSSLFGWYSLWIFCLLINISYCVCISLPMAHFVCGCLYIDGICDHFNLSIESLQQRIRLNRITKKPLKYSDMSRDIKQKLCDAIELHSKIFEWVNLQFGIGNEKSVRLKLIE